MSVEIGIPYIFHRAEGFYPLMLGSNEEAIDNGNCNPGTLRVTNALTGETIWTPEPKETP